MQEPSVKGLQVMSTPQLLELSQGDWVSGAGAESMGGSWWVGLSQDVWVIELLKAFALHWPCNCEQLGLYLQCICWAQPSNLRPSRRQ